MISQDIQQKIDKWIEKYPKNKQKSAVMYALKLIQDENDAHYLTPENIEEVAQYLQMPVIEVAEVATFYENYNHQKTGTFTIRFCHNISCMLNGSDDLIAYLENKLSIKAGQTTKDGKITLKKVECLGACVGAPMMQIGDVYYEHLTEKKLDDIVNNLLQ